jgi:hypothetical protein
VARGELRLPLRDLIDRGKGARRKADARRPGERSASESPRLPDDTTEVIRNPLDGDDHPTEQVRHPIAEPVSQAGLAAPAPAPLDDSSSAPVAEVSPPRVSGLAATSGYHVTPSPQRAARAAGASVSQETVYAAVPQLPHPVGVLVVVEGEPEGSAYPIYAGATAIGRDADNDVRLTPVQVSRHHAALHHEDGVFWLDALATDNETAINGEAVDEAREIVDGDLLQVARTKLRFRTISGI